MSIYQKMSQKNKKKIYISEGIVCNTMWCVYLSDR